MTETRKKGLGKGLSALLSDSSPDDYQAASSSGAELLPIESIRPNPDQPRRVFTQAELETLAQSIAEKGVLQPILVRPVEDGYQIVAGERRWRASQIAQVHEIPALIRDLTDRETLEIAIVENVQREDLNPVEEARAYRQLVDRFEHTQDEIARAVGKSRSHVANMMRLLSLPESVLAHLEAGRLSMGHARAIATSDNAAVLADNIVAQGLSVRQAEQLVKSPPARKAPETKSADHKDADTRALEHDLSHRLGLPVHIDHRPNGESGSIRIDYKTLEQLDEVCRRLNAAG